MGLSNFANLDSNSPKTKYFEFIKIAELVFVDEILRYAHGFEEAFSVPV